MKKISLILLLCTIVIATGCPFKSKPKNPKVLKKLVNDEIVKLDNAIASYECAAIGETVVVNKGAALTKSCPSTTPDLDKAKRIRDSAIHRLIRVIDYTYFEFENELYVKRASGSFLADALDISANLAATITNGERAKTIINASLIAFRGGRKSGSLHFFQQQTADVLIAKMQTARNRELRVILTQLQDKDVDQYPLDAALGDVIRYFYAGTLPRALQELKKDTSIDAQEAEKAVRVLKGIQENSIATKGEREISVTAFGVLNKLALDSNNPTDSVKTEALAKLQKIANNIKNEKIITDELKKNSDLNALLTELTTNSKDGVNLANSLNDIRYEGEGILKKEVLEKIDKIIIEVGSN